MNIRRINLALFLILIAFSSLARPLNRATKTELDPPYNIYGEIEADYFNNGLQVDKRETFLNQLKIAKSLLIDGHSKDAILVLNKLIQTTKSYDKRLIINRFLALAYFSISDINKSREILDSIPDTATWLYQNCSLKIISTLSLPKTQNDKINKTFNDCINHYRVRGDNIRDTWLRLVLERKIKGHVVNYKVRDLFASNNLETINTILKYGIYFDENKQILKFYDLIPVELYADEQLRTLVATNLYNNAEFDRALKLVNSLNNTNANNIKGIEEVKKENYKTAYSHFISNLLTKPYSINANISILASAILSNNYKQARTALSKIPVSYELRREKQLLRINILLKEGKFKEATYLMNNLDIDYSKKLPYEAAILSTYLKLLKDDDEWKSLSDSSCLSKNVISCWLHMQSKVWQSYPTQIVNSDEKMEAKTIQSRLNSMITKKEHKEFNEPTLIYQKDIYELDLVSYPELKKSIDSQSLQ